MADAEAHVDPPMTDRDTRPAGTRSIEAIQDDFRAATTSPTGRSRPPSSWRSSSAGRCCSKARPASARPSWPRSSPRRLGARLIRLQCYEGLDVNTAVYEWNYPRQMLEIRLLEARGEAEQATAHDIFGSDFLIRRPLLQALEATDGVAPVLLIDEIDRADEEFEAYLLEILSDFQVTVPEIGTIRAETPPRVILTSNRTREVHDALKRRCLYHWIDYPTAQKEYEIVLARVPEAPERLAREVVGFVHRLREADLTKVPGHRRDARLGRRAPVARCPRAGARARRRDARRRPQVRGGHPPGPRRRHAALPGRGGGRRLTGRRRARRHDRPDRSRDRPLAVRSRGRRPAPAGRGGRVRARAPGGAPVDRPRCGGRLRPRPDPGRHRRPRAGPGGRRGDLRPAARRPADLRRRLRSLVATARLAAAGRLRAVDAAARGRPDRRAGAARRGADPRPASEHAEMGPDERGIADPDRRRRRPTTRRRSRASSSRPTPTRRARSCATASSTG